MSLPFVAVTVGMLIKQIAFDVAAGMAKRKLAESYLIKRLDKKIEKKFGKNFIKESLSPTNLEEVRKVVQEELESYGLLKDKSDHLIANALQKLSNEHDLILEKLDHLETIIEKITIPLAYQISKTTGDQMSPDLLEGLLKERLKGNPSASETVNELIEDGTLPQETSSFFEKWKFLKEIIDFEKKQIDDLLNKFQGTSGQINQLQTYLELGTILDIAESIDATDALITRLVSQGLKSPEMEKSVISICLIMDRLGKLERLKENDKKKLAGFLLRRIEKVNKPEEQLETYFILSQLGYADYINFQTILDIMDQFSKIKYDTTKQMKKQFNISVRVARFLRHLGLKKPPQTSIRTVIMLIKKLDKRKFARGTQLLEMQLDRLLTEINLLIAYFEKDYPKTTEINELIDFVQLLMNILNRPAVFNLDRNFLTRIIKLQDASLYLYDLLAMRNSRNLLKQYELNIRSIYTDTLGRYQRISPEDEEEIEKILVQLRFKARAMIASELPSPPKTAKEKKKQLKKIKQ